MIHLAGLVIHVPTPPLGEGESVSASLPMNAAGVPRAARDAAPGNGIKSVSGKVGWFTGLAASGGLAALILFINILYCFH